MQNNYVLTGSIASGKSSVLKIIHEEGYNIISADEIVSELYDDEVFLRDYKNFIGKEYFTEGLKLDKYKLRDDLFRDSTLKERVEAFVHPQVYKKIKESLKCGYNFIEIPLFFEAQKYFLESGIEIKGVIFVNIEKNLQVLRLMHRNKITKEEAESMIDSRISIDEKISSSDYIINNNSDLDNLKQEVLKTLEKINEKAN